MLDKWTLKLIKPPVNKTAKTLYRLKITPNQVTLFGFLVGMSAIPAIWQKQFVIALVLILLNRILDGIDGALARLSGPTDAGGYLDITLDFLFYSGIVWAFALSDPAVNGLAASTLNFAFLGTGTSFLAFGIMAAKRNIQSMDYPQKGFYYLGGLTEGTETIVVLCLFCIFPQHFPIMAYVFSGLCGITIATRIIGGYYTLSKN